MTHAVVIINPLSGHGRRTHDVEADATLARDVLRSQGLAATIRPTAGVGDAHAFANAAVRDGVGLVVAWGGDGTVNEVASALVGTPVPLAIVPAGSGNGLASDLGVPRDPRAALTVAATGRLRSIDAGRANQSWFFNIAGIGIDALIAARFAERGLHRRGPLAYLQLGLREIPRFQPVRYAIEIDGEPCERDVLLLALANGRQYGNGLIIAPQARVDDGVLELVLAGPLPLAAVIARLPALFRGSLRADQHVIMRQVTSVRISRPGAIPFHVDGEPRVARECVTVGLARQALQIRVPAL